jgi:hypothetical protein
MCKDCPTINSLSFNKEKTLLAVKNDDSYIIGDTHQTLLNIVYSEWQKPENDAWTYAEVIKFAIKEYGELVAFAVLIGKYNNQVCNGGHVQYYDNGYASGEGGFMDKHGSNTDLHDLLLSYYLRNDVLHKFSWYHELKDILEKFLKFHIDNEEYESGTCSECSGSGVVESEPEDDDEEPSEEKCYTCNGSGEEDYSNESYQCPVGHDWDNLDTRFCKINEQVEKDLNMYFKFKLM